MAPHSHARLGTNGHTTSSGISEQHRREESARQPRQFLSEKDNLRYRGRLTSPSPKRKKPQ
jgi:hypothetical protein